MQHVNIDVLPRQAVFAQDAARARAGGLHLRFSYLTTGWLADAVTTDNKTDYQRLFSIPMWITVACLAALLAFYPRRPPGRAVSS